VFVKIFVVYERKEKERGIEEGNIYIGMLRVQISARTSVIFGKDFGGFLQSFQINPMVVPRLNYAHFLPYPMHFDAP
jgi:hypothetical protein